MLWKGQQKVYWLFSILFILAEPLCVQCDDLPDNQTAFCKVCHCQQYTYIDNYQK